ncbi:MAG: transposase [Candidatus Sulfotelmatobacter sp.]
MLFTIPFGGLLFIVGHTLVRKRCSTASIWKIRFLKLTCGPPSTDPELGRRILLIVYLYGVTSERKLVEELRMHLARCRCTGWGSDQEISHHSTFSRNRHGRFRESKLFEQRFEELCASVWKCD